MRYAHPRWTRVTIADDVTRLWSPTVAELDGSTDVSADLLVEGGLNIDRDDVTISHEPWRGPIAGELITGYTVGVDLLANRRTSDDTESLWALCAIRNAPGVLIVRRGIPRDTAWAAGQRVEALRFRYGKRATVGTDGGGVKFHVHLTVSDDEDEAVVAA